MNIMASLITGWPRIWYPKYETATFAPLWTWTQLSRPIGDPFWQIRTLKCSNGYRMWWMEIGVRSSSRFALQILQTAKFERQTIRDHLIHNVIRMMWNAHCAPYLNHSHSKRFKDAKLRRKLREDRTDELFRLRWPRSDFPLGNSYSEAASRTLYDST